ncbi:hypothetical protein BN938_2166 [Mucinivorans hirudinis]|uniref:Uncharacterized protein n=1 Tax=Mucinivorans hirudinis TaxID=1433126 RepID=A0A060RDZ4_9BACT|nr:hypothetical protein BN938_2166 [Mucinivorans hirudinis]
MELFLFFGLFFTYFSFQILNVDRYIFGFKIKNLLKNRLEKMYH